MIDFKKIVKINDYLWEIPKNYRSDMRVPARIFATEKMLGEILEDRSLEQLINVATLAGIQKAAMVMPDVHEGYGFPIGGVAAIAWPEGIISPGGIGYDINCGVRLLKSKIAFPQLEKYIESLAKKLFETIPSGLGRGGKLIFEQEKLDNILEKGVPYIIEKGYGEKEDLSHIESQGFLKNADSKSVSDHAKKRGRDQLGTMGSGNHFVEVDLVEKIYDEKIAKDFGLFENQVVILIHTGSRGLGHQVATDYIRLMISLMGKYNISVPDRELACVPFSSPEGTQYFNAMAAAANFAWSNRQLITQEVRSAWKEIFENTNERELSILYDVAHNIAKVEEHEINGEQTKVIVHRKGATRAFPNQPVIIPGSMGTRSYVLVGTEKSMKESFGSSCHGSGRRMSRHAARKEILGRDLLDKLKKQGIFVKTGSVRDLAEEGPFAYKDIDQIVDVVHRAGIANKVARLKPVIVVKG